MEVQEEPSFLLIPLSLALKLQQQNFYQHYDKKRTADQISKRLMILTNKRCGDMHMSNFSYLATTVNVLPSISRIQEDQNHAMLLH